MKKIVILGNGYVGGYLYDRLQFPGPGKKLRTTVNIEKRKLLNYNDIKKLEQYIDKEKPDYIINCSDAIYSHKLIR